MKSIRWNPEKNEQLRIKRGVSFDMIVEAIERGNLLDDIPHPNQELYPNQRILIVKLANYVYEVPYVESNSEKFLKTLFPSRKATKKYLTGEKTND
jgi:hypothetical protein